MTAQSILWDRFDVDSQQILSCAAVAMRGSDESREPVMANVAAKIRPASRVSKQADSRDQIPPIDSIALLAGMLESSPQTSELQQFLDAFSISPQVLIDSVQHGYTWPATSGPVEPLVQTPPLDDDAERIVATAVELAETHNAAGSRLVTPRHLLGAVLQSSGTPAYVAIMITLKQDGVDDTVVHEMMNQTEPYLSGQEDIRELRYRAAPLPLDRGIWPNGFSESSRRAISHAYHLATHLGRSKIHMEHLIAGMYENPDGLVRQMFTTFVDATELQEAIDNHVGKPTPLTMNLEQAVVDNPLTSLPTLSGHADEALRHARRIADRAGSSEIRLEDLLGGVLSVDACGVISVLNGFGIGLTSINFAEAPSTTDEIAESRIAGVVSDTTTGEDLLGITGEVERLCKVIAAHKVKPPLAIGLFGDWGSGKSFFMEKMYQQVTELKTRAREANGRSAWCPNIVQIRFNAWHYIDSQNLWASLAAEIFEGLSKALDEDVALIGGLGDPATARKRLINATITLKKSELAIAEQAKDAAEAELTESERALDALRLDVERAERRLDLKILAQEVASAVAGESDVQRVVDTVTTELDLGSAGISKDDVARQVLGAQEAWSRRDALRIALEAQRTKQHVSIWLIPVIAAAIILAAPWLLIWLTGTETFQSVLGSVVAAGVVIAPVAIATLQRARRIYTRMRDVRGSYAAKVADEQNHHRLQLEDARDKKLAKANEEQQRVERVTQEIDNLKQQIDELRADWKLGSFIRQRHDSSVYSSHRGIIAQAHDDFAQLSDLLTAAANERSKNGTVTNNGDQKQLPVIDRIILYIDDLDRCGEDQVVAVLQAVHLLLAFPLFVVVVGVDSRWLLHSLRQHSEVFHDPDVEDEADDNRRLWQSTPLNYLEKIFQIPYTLRPMDAKGFTALINDLTADVASEPESEETGAQGSRAIDDGAATRVPSDPEQSSTTGVAAAGLVDRQAASVEQPQVSVETTQPAMAADHDEPIPAPQSPETKSTVPTEEDDNPAFLDINEHERGFMVELGSLIGSPRAAKRFVNTYRLLKASFQKQLDPAHPSNSAMTQHQVPMLLLAILAGYPDEAMDLFDNLLRATPTESWWSFVARYEPLAREGNNGNRPSGGSNGSHSSTNGNQQSVAEGRGDPRVELAKTLLALRTRNVITAGHTCADFHTWVPHVARFSYLSRNLLLRHAASR